MNIIGLAGWSGAGKTTLLSRLIPHLKARGLAVSDGLGMLLHQGTICFEKWFGVRPVVTAEQRQRVEQALRPS